MFDVMIIDDDLQIRQRLKSIIDWQGLQLRLVCEAADSDTARELYLLHRPKIIITDINIPIISGLDLAEELQKEDPELRFIVITGYQDFELARRSVNLGAVDLLSKPIFPDTIRQSLLRAIEYFEQRREVRTSLTSLQQLVDANLPLLQETFMANLLRQPPANPALVPERIARLRIDCAGPYYAAVLATIRPSAAVEDYETAALLLRQILSEQLGEAGCACFSWLDSHVRLCCVVSTDLPQPDNLIEERLTRAREQMKFMTGAQVLAGIGPTVDHPGLLYRSRSGALTALNYLGILGDETVAHYKNLARTDVVFHSQESIHAHLLQQFRENRLEQLETDLRNHVSLLASYGRDSARYLRDFLFEYAIGVTNEALRLGLKLERIDAYLPILSRLFQQPGDGRVDDVLDLTAQLLSQLFHRHASSTNHLISLAKDFIRENLQDEQLCLDTVSNHVGLSRIYFCKLFHQVEGISFNNYLKRERLDVAKRLLQTTSMKVFEISAASGFSNAKYFSYVFKQAVGQTPLEYQRNSHG